MRIIIHRELPADANRHRYARYCLTPIRLAWSARFGWGTWFTWHGWQVGADGMEKRVYGWTLHLGPLKVCFGRKRGYDHRPCKRCGHPLEAHEHKVTRRFGGAHCPDDGGLFWARPNPAISFLVTRRRPTLTQKDIESRFRFDMENELRRGARAAHGEAV